MKVKMLELESDYR